MCIFEKEKKNHKSMYKTENWNSFLCCCIQYCSVILHFQFCTSNKIKPRCCASQTHFTAIQWSCCCIHTGSSIGSGDAPPRPQIEIKKKRFCKTRYQHFTSFTLPPKSADEWHIRILKNKMNRLVSLRQS